MSIDKVKQYIKMMTHNTIILMFLSKSGVKWLICVRLMSYKYIESQSLNDYNPITHTKNI